MITKKLQGKFIVEHLRTNLLLFVYGTLLQGKHRHGTLKDSEFVDYAHTSFKYLMQDSGFPMVFEPIDLAIFPETELPREDNYYGQIKGEIYLINPETQTHLDQIEGVPHLYFRKDIVCLDGKGISYYPYMYITQPVHFNKTKLFSVNEQGFHNYDVS